MQRSAYVNFAGHFVTVCIIVMCILFLMTSNVDVFSVAVSAGEWRNVGKHQAGARHLQCNDCRQQQQSGQKQVGGRWSAITHTPRRLLSDVYWSSLRENTFQEYFATT